MNRVLAYITPARAFVGADSIYMQAASGRVAEAMAAYYEKVVICARVVHGPPPAQADLPFRVSNLELVPQPDWHTSLGSLPHFFGIARAYFRACRRSDAVFVRGMCPYIGVLYLYAFLFRRPICHWIVGNPVTLLRTAPRRGRILNTLALFYAIQDRLASRIGRWLTNGAFICNGRELAAAYRSPRTAATVSSTMREDEFFSRMDTCQGSSLRILFVGYIRPEKGIEYLLEAVSQLDRKLPWELLLLGPAQFPEYRRRLDEVAAARHIGDRVRWVGYVSFGQPLFDHMRAADLLVLPSLSEGTPHVLVEARANSLPCISTTVGGIPTTVTDEVDALLVPPKNSRALSGAIERIVFDGELRRRLIRNGFAAARSQTLDHFVSLVRTELDPNASHAAIRVPQE